MKYFNHEIKRILSPFILNSEQRELRQVFELMVLSAELHDKKVEQRHIDRLHEFLMMFHPQQQLQVLNKWIETAMELVKEKYDITTIQQTQEFLFGKNTEILDFNVKSKT
jgi:deoxyhypusine synthase